MPAYMCSARVVTNLYHEMEITSWYRECSRVPQLTCIWMSVGRRNARTQSNLTLAASGAFKSSRTPQKIHF